MRKKGEEMISFNVRDLKSFCDPKNSEKIKQKKKKKQSQTKSQ